MPAQRSCHGPIAEQSEMRRDKMSTRSEPILWTAANTS